MIHFLRAKKWFTLIEMLIVIVIIGILLSALIPRLSQARERANDTARKAHIQNIAAVLIAYQIDKWRYPTTAWSISSIETELVGAGLSSVPIDPDQTRSFLGIQKQGDTSCVIPSSGWQYMYTPIKKRGVTNAGFVLMAATQTEWWSNRVYQAWSTSSGLVNGCINTAVNYASLTTCQTLTSSSSNVLSTCLYDATTDALRYIYMY